MARNLTYSSQIYKILTELKPDLPIQTLLEQKAYAFQLVLCLVLCFTLSLQILSFSNCHISPNKYSNNLDIRILQGTLKKYRIIKRDYSSSFNLVRTYKNCHSGKIWNLLKDYFFFSLS